MNKYVPLALGIAGLLALGVLSFCETGGAPGSGTVPAASTEEPPPAREAELPLQTDEELGRQLVESPLPDPDAATEEGTGSLRVRVVDTIRDAPAAGIGLVLRELAPERPPPRNVQADEGGEVVLTGLRPGDYVVRTDQHHPTNVRAEVVAERETEVTLSLDDCIHLTGIVVDAAGTPVAGAAVLLGGWGGEDPVVVTRTSGDGRFAIRPAPRIVNVAARAADHAPSPYRTVTAGAGADVDLRIVLPGEGGTVSGIVLDPGGREVAGALVGVGGPQPPPIVITLPDGAQGMHPPQPQAKSDASGRFVIAGVEPGHQPVTVTTGTFAPWTGEVDVVARRDMGLTIHLAAGTTLEGTVRNEGGELMGDVHILLGQVRSVDRRTARTGPDGAFRLTGLSPDKPLAVIADGGDRGRTTTEIQGRPGETVVWHATLSRGTVLRGRVVGRNGQPLENAQISASTRTWIQFATTDADGGFEVAGFPQDEPLRLDVTARAHARLRRTAVDPASGPLLLQMVYEGEPDVRIVGRLVDSEGAPVADAQISVGRDGSGGGGLQTSGADGAIAMEGIRPGLLNVRIRAGSFAHFMSEERQVSSGETWDLGTVFLMRGGHLEVHLQRTEETEDARISASIYRGEQWLSGFDTRPAELRSEPLAPGDYELRVWGPAVAPVTMPFAIRADQMSRLEVRPEPAEPCAVEIRVPEGRNDVRFVEYQVADEARVLRSGRASRREDGTYGFETGLKVGRYTLRAWTDDGLGGELAFDVQESIDVQQVRLALQ